MLGVHGSYTCKRSTESATIAECNKYHWLVKDCKLKGKYAPFTVYHNTFGVLKIVNEFV